MNQYLFHIYLHFFPASLLPPIHTLISQCFPVVSTPNVGCELQSASTELMSSCWAIQQSKMGPRYVQLQSCFQAL